MWVCVLVHSNSQQLIGLTKNKGHRLTNRLVNHVLAITTIHCDTALYLYMVETYEMNILAVRMKPALPHQWMEPPCLLANLKLGNLSSRHAAFWLALAPPSLFFSFFSESPSQPASCCTLEHHTLLIMGVHGVGYQDAVSVATLSQPDTLSSI
eukprot:1161726-Pelagomonas_calceolata.AAC.1